MHLIWHSRRGRRRNHLWQIFWWSVEGCRFCRGSKIALSHWQSQWPLTQGCRYRAACDMPVILYVTRSTHPLWSFLARTASRCRRAYVLLLWFFLSSFFRRLICEVTERISTKLGTHNHLWLWFDKFGPNFPGYLPSRAGAKTLFWGQSLNFDQTYLVIVCPSVTSRQCTKTAKRTMTQTTPWIVTW